VPGIQKSIQPGFVTSLSWGAFDRVSWAAELGVGSMRSGLILFFLLIAAAWGDEPRAVVIAHRSASGYLPEHSLAAAAYAHALGTDYIEPDVVLSKDGVPVVLHDIEIDTVTDVATRFPGRQRANGHFYAIDFTLAEIRQLRVTERFDPGTGQAVFPRRFPAGAAAFSVPTLDEFLELVKGLNRSTGREVGVYPEIKAPGWHRRHGLDISVIVLEALARHGYRTKEDRFYLQCFDAMEVLRLREELGFQGRLVQLIGRYADGEPGDERHDNSILLTREGLAGIAQHADGIGPSLAHLVSVSADGKAVPGELVKWAHEAGLVVHPYTFRADALPAFAGDAKALLELLFGTLKVDGVFADQPDIVLRDLEERAGEGGR